MTRVLEGLQKVFMVWVDYLIVWGHSQDELFANLSDVLDRLHDVGLFVVAHKCRFVEPTVT